MDQELPRKGSILSTLRHSLSSLLDSERRIRESIVKLEEQYQSSDHIAILPLYCELLEVLSPSNQLERAVKGEEIVRSMCAIFEKYPEVNTESMRRGLGLASEYMAAGDQPQRSIRYLERLLRILKENGGERIDPQQSSVMKQLARVHLRLSHPEQALRFGNMAMACLPSTPSIERAMVLKLLGDIFLQTGNDERFIARYLRAIEMLKDASMMGFYDKEIAEMLVCVGNRYESQHNMARALELFNQALALYMEYDMDNESINVLLKMGCILQQQNTKKQQQGQSLLLRRASLVNGSTDQCSPHPHLHCEIFCCRGQ